MKITETQLKGCFILEPTVYEDERGIFFESYHKTNLEKALGETINFVQDNISVSKKGVLRGLHFQAGKHAQAKLVQVLQGEVLDVVVDLRKESNTYGQHFKLKLSSKNKKLLFIPKGMAHGFLALTPEVIFAYKCDCHYHKESERGIRYNDPDLDIDWETKGMDLILSPKDLDLPLWKDLQV
ncbi:dTDP-4-dehydrorhamnose 3,5-epimerase [Arenibacter aquaticus]|uniref:dTDP-4-dehydrorhamnose 3,5-epimerase n=1 Tax=Arenibacter aquaticus TaxID=2489054 RepID=A0A430K748_9FLAO|nr:dTDP-4-dehydrorhamnose 3,5-epimerase [Arenibacter aquaticus]RTE54873.1 dTDP-4-dehydrorhamnose 3,5-epimerase [Arenibacter aquaticus]